MTQGEYVKLPLEYLALAWFQELSGFQQALFLYLYSKACRRRFGGMPGRCVRIGLRSIGEDMNVDKMKAKRAMDELVRLRVVEVVCEAEGRAPATYRLAEPVELLCTAVCVSPSHGNAIHNESLRLSNTNDCETQTPQRSQAAENPVETRRNDGFVSHAHTGTRDTLFTPLRGESTYDSPCLGTGGDSCVSPAEPEPAEPPRPIAPACPKCRRPMERTNTFMPGGKRRIWRCQACREETAVADADLSRPAYSTPRPRGRPAGAGPPPGGQDRATRIYD